MKDYQLEPYAPVLLESMRAIGYVPEAAIADLLDNSISAAARRMEIFFPAGRPDHVAILDDGSGMTADRLLEAMRHGSRSPNDQRAEDDLGRFGLGLKTASLSQCRRLEVVTLKDGQLSGAAWDLDHVADRKGWILQILEKQDFESIPQIDRLRAQKSGTLVAWRKLDRLAAGDRGDGAVLSEAMSTVRHHLALVFHRFLSGEVPGRQIEILINNQPLASIDPFLSHAKSRQRGPVETIDVDSHKIQLQAHTLPHISNLTRQEIETAGGAEGLRREQGFYVYRNFRLIVWGTWFRMFRQEELTKLTRVRVDIPNTLDHLWTLDIKKSMASPPEIVRERLRNLVPRMCQEGRLVQQYRGRIQVRVGLKPIWKRIEAREGIEYRISDEHPAIVALRQSLDDAAARQLGFVLRAIAEGFPGETFYNDRAADLLGHKEAPVPQDEAAFLEELARQILSSVSDLADARRQLLASLDDIEPFSRHPALTKAIQEKLLNE